MRLLLWYLVITVMAKNHHRHSNKSTQSTTQPRTQHPSLTTITVTPSPSPYFSAVTLSTTPATTSRQLLTRDSGDLRTLNPHIRSRHRTTTTTLPVTATVTSPPELLTTTEAITITTTASPPIVPSSSVGSTAPLLSSGTPPDAASALATSPAAKCYESSGGVQTDGKITSGCGGMLAHLQACSKDYISEDNVASSGQNHDFQACVCVTSNEQPFTSNSILYKNFTACAACLLSLESSNSKFVYTAAQLLWSFCRSQNPFPYIFYSGLNSALRRVPTQTDRQPAAPFSLSPDLKNAASTTPPLANLAYGASAPPDGSLAKVTPSLTTYTTSMTKGVEGSVVLQTITSLVAWVPTEAGKAWHAASASQSEASAVSSRLASDLCNEKDLGQCAKNDVTKMNPWIMLVFLCATTLAAMLLS